MLRSYNISGFSIVIALVLTFLLSFIGLFLLEYSIPFARNTKGVENASQAYYQAYAGIEESLYEFYNSDVGEESQKSLSESVDYGYQMQGNGARFPELGEGNSGVNVNWNRISLDDPVQLFVGRDRLAGASFLRFRVRVPNFDANRIEKLDTTTDDDLILWQLSSSNGSLFTRKGSLITESEINGSGITKNIWSDDGAEQGDINSSTGVRFSNFYDANCTGPDDECILKISIIGDLLSSSGNEYPYLEYIITTPRSLPAPFMQITSEGKSFNYSRSFDISVAQDIGNSSLDFTIFQ